MTTKPLQDNEFWVAGDTDYAYYETASKTPEEAAEKFFEDHEYHDASTVRMMRRLDATHMLYKGILSDLAEGIGDSLCEQYEDWTAEGEMVNSLYKPETAQELKEALRPALEEWWRKHCAGFGVKDYWLDTGEEVEIQRKEAQP